VRRHEVDVFSLVFGLLFLGAALIWGLAEDPGSALQGWPLPVLLIAVGLAGLLSSIGGWRGRRSREAGPTQPTEPADSEAPGAP
jgi:hypothetical protein